MIADRMGHEGRYSGRRAIFRHEGKVIFRAKGDIQEKTFRAIFQKGDIQGMKGDRAWGRDFQPWRDMMES
jgi:hypothetical protein